MKIEDLCEPVKLDPDFSEYDKVMENALSMTGDLQFQRDLENSYDEIKLLHQAIKEKDFGILIGKENQTLTYNDIQEIKVTMHKMFKSNIFFKTTPKNEQEFEVSIRKLGHRVESILLTAFSGLFALSSVVTGPFGLLIGAGSFLLGRRSANLAKAIETSSQVLNVAQSFQKLQDIDKGRARKIEKLVKERNPKELEKQIRADAKRLRNEIPSNFLKDLKRLPSHIEYEDESGETQLYPIEKLFAL